MFSVILLAGCKRKIPPANADIKAFQKYYSGTKWYFRENRWNPESIDDFIIQRRSSSQAFLESSSGTNIIYTEFEPNNCFKSFRGNGILNKIPDVCKPIFQVESDYTERNPDKILLIGFIGARRFQIEAKSYKNINKEEILKDAVTLADIVYNYYDNNSKTNH